MDDIHGWNLVDNNADLTDNTGHGTEVAGVIAATTDNSLGIAGVCWQCRLMVVKVVQSGGVANYSTIAAGVYYAAQKGAKIINISLGGNSDSITLKTAIANAAQTAVVVAGTGNDNSSTPFYPAAYEDYVLAVAGTTQTDTKVGTSNYGMWVDVSAPGESIQTTFAGGGYGDASGTSVSTPFVSGLAALLRSQNLTWSANLVRAQIFHTTDNIDSANPSYAGKLGSGRINAQKAVTTAATPQLSAVSYTVNGIVSGTPAPGSTVNLVVTIRNTWGLITNAIGTLGTSDPYVTVSSASASFGSIDAYGAAANTTPFVFSVSPSAPYGHNITFLLTVSGGSGFSTTLPLTITTQGSVVNVTGIIDSNATWTADRIYVINGDVLVSEGVTLTITAGTAVKFNGFYQIVVRGQLIAIGTPSSPIIFTSNFNSPARADWNRIVFEDLSVDAVVDVDGNYVSGSTIQYSDISYGGTVMAVGSSPFIGHNHIHDGAPTWYEGSGYQAGTNAVTFYNAGTAYIVDNLIENIIFGGEPASGGGGAVLIRDTITGHILRNVIRNVSNGDWASGIFCIRSNCVIKNNQITSNTDGVESGGIYLYEGLHIISGNLIGNNSSTHLYSDDGGDALEKWGGATISMTNNTVVGNFGFTSIHFRDTSSQDRVEHNNIIIDTAMEPYVVYLNPNQAHDDLTAPLNYWGTTETALIDAQIFDFNDNFNAGLVTYQPILTGPESTAPPFLHQLFLDPPSPVGIQRVTFNLIFSKSMDQSINPEVTFGTTSPYASYAVFDNAQWLNDHTWFGTYDITSLVPRGTYTVSVSLAKGTDGMEIPADTRFSFVVDYAGQIIDQTPPNVPLVIASGKEGDPSTVEAVWWASDPDSSVTTYRYAIGSAPSATDVVNWTTTSENSFTKNGLGFVEGRQYWVAIQARNVGGLWSTSGYSAFVAGQEIRKVYLPLVIRNQ